MLTPNTVGLMRGPRSENTEKMVDYDDFTSKVLADALAHAGLATSGNKGTRAARLADAGISAERILVDPDGRVTLADSSGAVLTAEVVEDADFASRFIRRKVELFGVQIPAIALVGVLLLGTLGAGFLAGPMIMAWLQPEPEYELIDFDTARARGFAEHLVSLGHPEWAGRHSGSAEELATAESNKANFTSAGMAATIEGFNVKMFEITDDPILRYCIPGTYGGLVNFNPEACGFLDSQATVVEFDHRMDYVIQGYSGNREISFGQDMELINLSNGTDDSLWAEASENIGLVWSGTSVGGNTDLYRLAINHTLAALLVVNTERNCGQVEADDCVPIFKTVDTESLLDDPGHIPPDIGFLQLSRETGEELWQAWEDKASTDVRIGMYVPVDNQGEREVRVPCGIIPGKSEKLIIFGAHHDTVYNGPGAIDDTSGTATVLELAQQFGYLLSELGEPKHTLKFCTWGGEEEGLHGSKAWVDKYAAYLNENLIVYINLDMNHADLERGNGLTLFGNYQSDVDHITRIVEKFNTERSDIASNYDISINVKSGAKNTPTGMPYNSDHGPFVYDTAQDDGDANGHALVCYGSGSWEYHTYKDDMSRFNEESLAVSGIVYGTYARWLAWGET